MKLSHRSLCSVSEHNLHGKRNSKSLLLETQPDRFPDRSFRDITAYPIRTFNARNRFMLQRWIAEASVIGELLKALECLLVLLELKIPILHLIYALHSNALTAGIAFPRRLNLLI